MTTLLRKFLPVLAALSVIKPCHCAVGAAASPSLSSLLDLPPLPSLPLTGFSAVRLVSRVAGAQMHADAAVRGRCVYDVRVHRSPEGSAPLHPFPSLRCRRGG